MSRRERTNPAWYTPRVELAIYIAAGLTYCVLGIFHKFLLNWIIGPLWLIAWVVLVPAVIERLRPARPEHDRELP
jgi:tellurite resistance protein TehA-like permease